MSRRASQMELAAASAAPANVFSRDRQLQSPKVAIPCGLRLNRRMRMDGLKLLGKLPADSVPVAFSDPQHRGVLGKLGYGNEGKARCKSRCELAQMPEELIGEFMWGTDAALIPSGHLFLWMDKFRLCTGFSAWLAGTRLAVVGSRARE